MLTTVPTADAACRLQPVGGRGWGVGGVGRGRGRGGRLIHLQGTVWPLMAWHVRTCDRCSATETAMTYVKKKSKP